ncbi:MAG: alpha/beta fold hydrolase, partial [Chloroflexota bacterium]
MNIYRRAIRFFLTVVLIAFAAIGTAVIFMTRRVLSPPRVPIWGDPGDIGIPFESITFPAAVDSVRINGWFVPAPAENRNGATVLIVHGWPWNRLGSGDEGVLGDMLDLIQIDLLPLIQSFHQQGYNVSTIDLRNHGESAQTGGISGGLFEARDVLGAINTLSHHQEVDSEKIGVMGFSMGANSTLFALPQTDKIKAFVAVQPTTPNHFGNRLSHYLLGPLGKPVFWLTKQVIDWIGEIQPFSVDPMDVAPDVGQVPILYLQSAGDRWGSVENVTEIAAATPGTVDTIIYAEGRNRDAGYKYAVDHPEIAISFFK